MDDAELLASLEEHSEVEVPPVQTSRDSGYGTVQGTSTLSSIVGNLVSRSVVKKLLSSNVMLLKKCCTVMYV